MNLLFFKKCNFLALGALLTAPSCAEEIDYINTLVSPKSFIYTLHNQVKNYNFLRRYLLNWQIVRSCQAINRSFEIIEPHQRKILIGCFNDESFKQIDREANKIMLHVEKLYRDNAWSKAPGWFEDMLVREKEYFAKAIRGY